MNEISNLGYFLNSIKKTLPFEDTEDFKKKIDESKEFRIKVQKLVYLSKFFGWDNSYHFNFHENGPYSCQLSEDYRSIDSFNDKKHDYNFDNDKFKEFTMNQDTGYFESTSSILYYLSKMNLTQINKNEIISVVTSLKLQKKFRKMQEKDWFLIEVYFPTKNLYKQIEDFFKGLEYHPLIKEFLRLKQKTSPIPSFEDIGLIAYSKQKGHPIITNDRDITFFCEELVKNKLSGEIFALQDLDIYNN